MAINKGARRTINIFFIIIFFLDAEVKRWLRQNYRYFKFNYAQRVRVWLVSLARTKLAKENEPEENP